MSKKNRKKKSGKKPEVQEVEADDSSDEPQSPIRQFWELNKTIILALIIALSVRSFVIEPFSIPSGSMLPTLLIGDHLFVNKFVYGVKAPFVDLRLPGLREPERGEVVVFEVARDGGAIYPADRRPDLPQQRFVKRILGLPGDTIEVQDNGIWINGEKMVVESTRSLFRDERGTDLAIHCERLRGTPHATLDDPWKPGIRGKWKVEPGRYFMMGDNRDWSNDSRTWGTVRLNEMKGPAFILYWSWDYNDGWLKLLNPMTWWRNLTGKTRWGRMGQGIDTGCIRGHPMPADFGPKGLPGNIKDLEKSLREAIPSATKPEPEEEAQGD